MKEKDYKDKFCVYVKQKSMTPQPSERDDGSRNIAKRKQSGQIEEDFEPPQKKQKSGRELVTNRRINALKMESRAFRRGVLGDDMGQASGTKVKIRPQERRYKALNLVNTENGADSRRKIEESDDDFDPFVDVEYDCNLKDCQECGKVCSRLFSIPK